MSVRPIGSMLANRASQAAVTIALLAIAFACAILVVGIIGAVRGADATSTIVIGAVFLAVAVAALFGASRFRRAHVRAATNCEHGETR